MSSKLCSSFSCLRTASSSCILTNSKIQSLKYHQPQHVTHSRIHLLVLALENQATQKWCCPAPAECCPEQLFPFLFPWLVSLFENQINFQIVPYACHCNLQMIAELEY